MISNDRGKSEGSPAIPFKGEGLLVGFDAVVELSYFDHSNRGKDKLGLHHFQSDFSDSMEVLYLFHYT